MRITVTFATGVVWTTERTLGDSLRAEQLLAAAELNDSDPFRVTAVAYMAWNRENPREVLSLDDMLEWADAATQIEFDSEDANIDPEA